MDLIIELPDHVAAVWPDPKSAAAWLVAAATAEHDRQVMDTAREQANRIMAEAAATIGGAEPPAVPTPIERVAAVETDQTALRAQVREVGVGLAVAAGVSPEDAVAMIDAALAASPPQEGEVT